VQAPNELSRELRSAVLTGDHVRIGELAAGYITAVEQAWLALPQGDRARSPLAQQAKELLSWARDMAIIQRALNGEQLGIVENAIRYQSAGLPGSRSRGVQVRI
jgi:hypothetical protein